jgi:NAD+ kinase
MSPSPEVRVLDSVALLYHPARDVAIAEADWLARELRERGLEVYVGNGWDPRVVTDLCCDRDLLVALGGDGTILHVARLAAPYQVPILGVNLGRVGFLAELAPQSLHEHVDALAEGQFWLEHRTMLEVEWHSEGQVERFVSLNEVALARGRAPHAIHVHTLLDGAEFVTYTADGVLVATATGSTAYSLAAGGPILYPEARDFIITPVAPHLHIGRSVIVPQDVNVTLRLSSDRHAVLTVDGCDERAITGNDAVQICRSRLTAPFARLGPKTYFYAAIALRLK